MAYLKLSPSIIFVLTALSVIPLAAIIGHSTEELAKRVGPSIGGLLNATFGNLTELILALVAVSAGKFELVKASLIGSIMGNLLLVLGLSIFMGGLKYKIQRFNTSMAGMHSAMLLLAVGSMAVPTLFKQIVRRDIPLEIDSPFLKLSVGVSAVLVLLYVSSLYFSLITHKDIFRGGEPESEAPEWTKGFSTFVLATASIFVAVQSEILVHSFEPATIALHLSPIFVGIIIIPIIGNAAEHASAVTFAMKNKIDISLNICSSSSIQIAMFIAPLAVLLSPMLGHPMGFDFTLYELAGVSFAAVITMAMSLDGESYWLEGLQLLGVYIILALSFFFAR